VEQSILKHPTRNHAIIIAGDTLHKIEGKKDLIETFVNAAIKMQVVLACWVSPK